MLKVKNYKKKSKLTPEVIVATSTGVKYRMTEGDSPNDIRIMRIDSLGSPITIVPEVNNVIKLVS